MSTIALESLEERVAGRLAGRLAGHVQAPNTPTTAQVVSWMDLVDLCREVDEGLVAADRPSDSALGLHEAVVSLAIGCGTWLIHQIRSRSMDISGSGQKLDSLEASLELLRMFYRTWHPEVSNEEIEAIRRRVFNAAA